MLYFVTWNRMSPNGVLSSVGNYVNADDANQALQAQRNCSSARSGGFSVREFTFNEIRQDFRMLNGSI